MSKGGKRDGAGRKPGPQWNGTGSYQKKVRITVSLPPELYQWLKAEARRRGVSMSALVNEAIRKLKIKGE